ncbi:hypothetical protein GS399_00485 [Pedobacter sp. HMF7647]|uniref:Tetratricopeptide repeat protein n=1 Tax=Hufsiella arboris TaxID=2695275 RepID=A0A7K1Y4Y6_9SPHI|nr:hypothetical protein [Hufsiella arboris]MXV49431.1 hypothetical protein [Hufsiella arboris]
MLLPIGNDFVVSKPEEKDLEQLTRKDQFTKILSAFADNVNKPEIDPTELEELVNQYPYCQPLKMIRAAASKSTGNGYNEILPLAAIYSPDRKLLKRLIEQPEFFFNQASTESVSAEILSGSNLPVDNHDFEIVADNHIEPQEQIGETLEDLYEQTSEIPAAVEDAIDEEVESTEIQDSSLFVAENENAKPNTESEEDIFSSEVMEAATLEVSLPPEEDPDLAATEVVSDTTEYLPETVIPDLELEVEENSDAELEEKYLSHVENQVTEKTEEAEKQEIPNVIEVEKSPLVFDNIAGADYFVFDRSAVDPLKETRNLPAEQKVSEPVTKYHDEKMPYTFLWWLQKTRNEHADTYQPYANPTFSPASVTVKKNSATELNQQIIENIFHLQEPHLTEDSPENNTQTVQFETKHKEQAIIEKFITEEPQIKPPKPEKIDTENKARKSSEDSGDIISETLAQIYTDQMLYHKAIDTYKKLSLKFPEKKPYFADRISEIEKKIN